MTSPSAPPPDLTAYVDLRPFDMSDQDIFAAAVAALQLNLPGWIPREGNTEVLLMESFALEIAEAIVAVNRLPGAVVQALLLLAGVDKDFGAAPVASATFTFGDTIGHTIPGGTGLYLSLDDGTTVKFLVEPPGLVVAPGDSTGDVSIIGDVFTSAANGLTAPRELIMSSPIPSVEHVQLATTVADGRSAETDNQWRDRGVARLSRLSDALVLPKHFVAAALERPEVARAVGIDLWNPLAVGVPGDHPGHMTVAVLGDGGAALSTETKDSIEQDLEARAVAVLDVHVTDVTIVTVAFASVVHIFDGYDSASVLEAVEDAIRAYVDPMTWQWGGIIRHNEMVSLIDQVAGVDYVISVTIAGSTTADYTISGAASLPEAGTVAITSG